MKRILTLIFSVLLCCWISDAQQSQTAYKESLVVSFDEKVHDFGDILLSDGPVSCVFTFRNVGQKPFVIHQIASSCGCTTPTWTREPVMPGQSGRIDVSFSNDQGPYPFEKTLTVYISELKDRPVILKIKGQAHEKKKKIEEIFTVRLGQLGLRQDSYTIGYIEKGILKADETEIANLSGRAVKVEATDVSEGLLISVSPNPIPAKSKAKLVYSVDTRKMKADAWGRRSFTAAFKADGRRQPGAITVTGVIKDNFTNMTESQMKKAGAPVVEKSYYEFGTIAPGTIVEATFQIRNKGSEPLVIHKIDKKSDAVTVISAAPLSIKSGACASVRVRLDTSAQEGEVLEILTLVTNSPAKPLVNLFVTGIVNKQ